LISSETSVGFVGSQSKRLKEILGVENMAKRRENGAGTEPKQGTNGRWFMQVSYKDPETGDLKRTTVRGESQAEIKSKVKNLIRKTEAGISLKSKGVTFQEWLDTWLEVNKKNVVTGRSYYIYKNIVDKHIKETKLGKMPLEKVKRADLQKYFNEKSAELSPKYLETIKVVISDALNVAELDSMILKSPCKNIKLPAVVKEEINPLNIDEVKLLLDTAGTGSLFYNVLICALYTGMRRGEICGLRWQDIDFNKKQIAVKQQAKEDPTKENSLILGTLKTPAAYRTIPMDNRLMAVLKWYQAQQNKAKGNLGKAYNDLGLVFSKPTGDIMSPNVVSQRFHRLIVKTGIPKRTFHQVRHTFASVAISQGLSIQAVSKILGHEKTSITFDIYGHLMTGDAETVVKVVAAYYGI